MLNETLLAALQHSQSPRNIALTVLPRLVHCRRCTCLICSDLLSDEQDEQDRAERECDEQDDLDIDFVRGMGVAW